MTLPGLSVVIPNYNHARYLPMCLDAILQQSVQPAEIIIIDDASTDNSVEVIEGFVRQHSHIRFHRNPANKGVIFGMNRGLELARSDYVYFAAADDQVLPGLFEKSLRLLAEHPQAALCCAASEWREVDTGLSRHIGLTMADGPSYFSPTQLFEMEKAGKLLISSHTAVMNRQAILRAGGFVPELKWHCDWFAIYVAAFRQGICFVPESLAVFNIHPSSFSVRQKERAHREAHRQVLEWMLDLLNSAEYVDAAKTIRESGALFQFGKPILKVMLTDRRYRRFLTPAFLRKNLWQIFKLEVKKIMPYFLANWYFRMAGYKPKPKPS